MNKFLMYWLFFITFVALASTLYFGNAELKKLRSEVAMMKVINKINGQQSIYDAICKSVVAEAERTMLGLCVQNILDPGSIDTAMFRRGFEYYQIGTRHYKALQDTCCDSTLDNNYMPILTY